MSGSQFDVPSIESMFWEVPEGPVAGVIGIVNCSFVGCRFSNIAFAGSAQLRDLLSGGTSDEPPNAD